MADHSPPPIIQKRADFLACAASGHKWVRPAFVLQLRLETGQETARIGYTVTKRQGNAVVRNRIKRRLREVARLHMAPHMRAGCDYVLIGRIAAKDMPFETLAEEVVSAINKLHRVVEKKQVTAAKGAVKPEGSA